MSRYLIAQCPAHHLLPVSSMQFDYELIARYFIEHG